MAAAAMKRSFLASLCVVFITVTNALAHSGTTSLRGTVLDKSGAAIVGAKVTLTNAALDLSRIVGKQIVVSNCNIAVVSAERNSRRFKVSPNLRRGSM